MSCSVIKRLIEDICETKLPPQPYRALDPYRTLYLGHLSKYYGEGVVSAVNVAVNFETKISRVFGGTVELIGEVEVPIYLIVRIIVGNYDFESKTPLQEQREELQRTGSPSSGHVTLVIINPIFESIEYFDPNGAYTILTPPTIRAVQNYFNTLGRFQYYWIPSGDYCPRQGWQRIARDNYCSAWSLLYATIRILCPQSTREEAVLMLSTQTQDYLRLVMDKWICWLHTYLREMGIIQAYELIQQNLDHPRYDMAYSALFEDYDPVRAMEYLA